MPTSSSPSTSKRLLALLSLLQSGRDRSAPALADRLGVSERTVRRDVERLRELDYVIDATRGPDGGYRLAAGMRLPPLMLDDEQAVAIAIALRAAGSLGAGIEDAASRALGTIGRILPRRLAHRVELITISAEPLGRGALADPEVLLRISEAIRGGRELRFDYGTPAGGGAGTPPPSVRRAEPHHLLVHAGRWYLVAYATDRDDWRTYRVDRITPRMHDGARVSPRTVPGGDPAAFLRARFKGSDAADVWPCLGEATLRSPLTSIAPYLGDGTAHEVASGLCRVRLGSWSWGGLAAAFSRFDTVITVVEPAELRRAFADLGRRAVSAASSAGDPAPPPVGHQLAGGVTSTIQVVP